MKTKISKKIIGMTLALLMVLATFMPMAGAIQGPIPANAPVVDGVPQIWDIAQSNIANRWWIEATASSYQDGFIPGNALTRYFAMSGSSAEDAVPLTFAAFPDEDPTRPWLAEAGDNGAWFQVYLGGQYDAVRKVVIEFPSASTVYQYVLEGSKDGENWSVLADRSENARVAAGFTDIFHYPDLLYIRINFISDNNIGISDLRIYNYLREDMDNGSDTTLGPGAMGHWWSGDRPPGPVNTLLPPLTPAPAGIREGVHPARVAPAGVDPADHEAAIAASAASGNNIYGMMYDLGWTTTRVRVWNNPMSESAFGGWGYWRYQDIETGRQGENRATPDAHVNTRVFPPVQGAGATSSPENLLHHARFITGSGQRLSVNFHYSDSWADPQNQPKPYAWAELPFCLCGESDCPFDAENPNPNTNADLGPLGAILIPNFRHPANMLSGTIPMGSGAMPGGGMGAVNPSAPRPGDINYYGWSWPSDFEATNPNHWRAAEYGLVQALYQFTYDTIRSLIEQGTAPHIVAIGNEISNGFMWGSEYEFTNPYVDYHDYFHRFILGRGTHPNDIPCPADCADADGRCTREFWTGSPGRPPSFTDGVPNPGRRCITPDARGAAPRGGGVEWVTYRAAIAARNAGDMAEYERLMAQFDNSLLRLSTLLASGQRAVADLNEYFADELAAAGIGQMETEIHFAFNVFEQPRGGSRVLMDFNEVFTRKEVILGGIRDHLEEINPDIGMMDRIGISYYADWHGTMRMMEYSLVRLQKLLPGVQFNLSETRPEFSGTVNTFGGGTGATAFPGWMQDPNEVRNPLNFWDPTDRQNFSFNISRAGFTAIPANPQLPIPEDGAPFEFGRVPWNNEGDPTMPTMVTRGRIDQGRHVIDQLMLINDIPNNVGMGMWPWGGSGQSQTFSGGTGNRPWIAALAYVQSFATGVIESNVFVTTTPGTYPDLPATVGQLLRGGPRGAAGNWEAPIHDVAVVWDTIDSADFHQSGTFIVSGLADTQGNMTRVNAFVTVLESPPPAASYRMVVEGFDWGPGVTQLIISMGDMIDVAEINAADFTVSVAKQPMFGANPETGVRVITDAFLSDADGNRISATTGSFITLQMAVRPDWGITNPFRFQVSPAMANMWANPYTHTITWNGNILNAARTDKIMPITDGFYLDGSFTHEEVTLRYASFTPPEAATSDRPVIIWLHGAGEGSFNNTIGPEIAILGNRVTQLAAPEIQSIMGGAHVFVPTTPSAWMAGTDLWGGGSGFVSNYEAALLALIDEFIANTPGIDTSRIYIGGCSNGGYMVMRMLFGRPNLYAAAFPICLGYNANWFTSEKMESIAHIPIWMVHDLRDPTLNAVHTIRMYEQLRAAGAQNVRMTLTDGIYTMVGGTRFNLNAHWSWVPVLNNAINQFTVDYSGLNRLANGNVVTNNPGTVLNTVPGESIFEWMAGQRNVPAAPEVFSASNPNVLKDLLDQGDVILSTPGNLGIFAHHSPFVIPAGRTLTVTTALNVQHNATLIIEGTLIVADGGRVNNQGSSDPNRAGTIIIATGGRLINYGHVENVSNSTVRNYGTIVNNQRFEVRARTNLHSTIDSVIEDPVALNIHRDANVGIISG